MGEKFNGGHGAYICDRCSKTLWVGRDGSLKPEARQFISIAMEEGFVEKVGVFHRRFYCSSRCATRDAWRRFVHDCRIWKARNDDMERAMQALHFALGPKAKPLTKSQLMEAACWAVAHGWSPGMFVIVDGRIGIKTTETGPMRTKDDLRWNP